MTRRPSHPPQAAPDGAALAALQQVALKSYQAGQLPAALDACRKILALQAARPDVLGFAGMIALEQGEAAQAAEFYRKAIKYRPQFVEAHYNLGNALMKLGRAEDAVKHYRYAAELKPDLVPAINNLGNALHALGRFEDAAEAYRRVLRLAPDALEAQRNLGIALERAGRRTDAIEIYRMVVKRRPDWLVAYSNLANALLAEGNGRATVEVCDRWLKREPAAMEALALKGLGLFAAGDHNAARQLLDMRLVHSFKIAAPAGYVSIAEFNAALAEQVMAHPLLHVPPEEDPHYHHPALAITNGFFGPSDGPIAALEKVTRQAVADYFAALLRGQDHPFLKHLPKNWEFASWATVLNFQGNLTPHIHLDGYVSGVYYAQLPENMGNDEAGYLELGRPPADFPLVQSTDLVPIKPEEGLMVLFPSYFYHRTIPFEADRQRISIAFDTMPRD